MDVTGREIFAFQLFNIRSRFLVFLAPLFVTVVPDYLSLLETRFLLRLMQRYRTFGFWGGILALDLVLTGLTGVIGLDLGPEFMGNAIPARYPGHLLYESEHLIRGVEEFIRIAIAPVGSERYYRVPFLCFWLPCFFTSIWLWLYAASGFLLKAARRFDLGFQWFNRHADIEKKPLQSIGLVAGVLVAVVYWSAVIVSRVVK